ncbi:yjeF-related family protein, partial [Vibrio parahaemolyticus V-223/04]|jgi:hypothetical protein
LC